MANTVAVTIAEETEDAPFDMRIERLIPRLHAALESVPDEYKHTAILDARGDYDGDVSFSISYERPMTPSEISEEAESAAFEAQWIANLKAAGYSNGEIRSCRMGDGLPPFYRPDVYPRKATA